MYIKGLALRIMRLRQVPMQGLHVPRHMHFPALCPVTGNCS